MLVKIGDTIYDSTDQPIGLFLNEAEENDLQGGFGETHFHWFFEEDHKSQEGLEAFDKWAKDFVDIVEDSYYEPEDAPES